MGAGGGDGQHASYCCNARLPSYMNIRETDRQQKTATDSVQYALCTLLAVVQMWTATTIAVSQAGVIFPGSWISFADL
jgi:hypothetical protein